VNLAWPNFDIGTLQITPGALRSVPGKGIGRWIASLRSQ
jgi:hypothetical protein